MSRRPGRDWSKCGSCSKFLIQCYDSNLHESHISAWENSPRIPGFYQGLGGGGAGQECLAGQRGDERESPSNVERVGQESDKRMKTVDMIELEMNEMCESLKRNSVMS